MDLRLESLAKVRNQLGLTQDKFAERLGISRPYLSKLENSSGTLSPKLARCLEEVCSESGFVQGGSLNGIRSVRVLSWAQAGTGSDSEELPFNWQKQVPTDCPDEQAFAVEIQGDSMESKFSPGDIAVLMPGYQPRNGNLVVARLEREGVVFKVFTVRDQSSARICSFTSYNPAYPPIEVPESSVIWNRPVYQIIRQIWR